MTRARKKNRPDLDARRQRTRAKIEAAPKPGFEIDAKTAMLEELWGEPQAIADWFVEPWQDGRHAIALCLRFGGATGGTFGGSNLDIAAQDAEKWLHAFLTRSNFNEGIPATQSRARFTTKDYEAADVLRYELSRTSRPNNVFYEAAMLIAGNWIANSDGGGHVPNVHLNNVFWQRLRVGDMHEDAVHAAVGAERARDRGLDWFGPSGQTFRWFWMNHRYRMAMSLPSKR